MLGIDIGELRINNWGSCGCSIEHMPTKIEIISVDEKSYLQNKSKANEKLYAALRKLHDLITEQREIILPLIGGSYDGDIIQWYEYSYQNYMYPKNSAQFLSPRSEVKVKPVPLEIYHLSVFEKNDKYIFILLNIGSFISDIDKNIKKGSLVFEDILEKQTNG